MLRWEVLAAFRAAIDMRFEVVRFVVVIGRECEGLFVGWK